MPEDPVDLGSFVEAAGAGLSDAQHSIAGTSLDSTAMAVSEATLEAKVALALDDAGAVQVQTVDRKQLQSLGSGAASLSTVTVNFVALTEAAERPGATPPVVKDKAIDVLAKRADVVRLGEVLGPLRFDAAFVPERSAWLVSATDEQGRRVREILVDEEA